MKKQRRNHLGSLCFFVLSKQIGGSA